MIHLVTWLPLPYQVTLCQTLSQSYGGDLVAWFAEREHVGFPYRSLPHYDFAHHFLCEVGYRKLFKELKTDREAVVVLCGWSSPMTKRVLTITTLLNIPVFVWADHPHPRKRARVTAILRQIFLRVLARKAAGFLACGTPTVEHLVSLGIEREKITNFPYWVELPEQWSLPNGYLDQDEIKRPLRLLSVGRHVAVKQIEVAIEAVALANRRAGTKIAELEIVGDGPEHNRLVRIAESVVVDGSVQFRGWLENDGVFRALGEVDVLVVTSQFEPYCVVVLEAMAAGRPVFASSGVVAALDRDEGTGALRLHQSGDVEGLAEDITLLASDREQLRKGSLAARSMAEKWRPERASEILDNLLPSLNPDLTRPAPAQSERADPPSGIVEK